MMTHGKRHHVVNHHAAKEQCGTIEWTRHEYREGDRTMIVYSPSIRFLPEKIEKWLGEKWVRKQLRIVWQPIDRQWQLVIPCSIIGYDTDWRPPTKDLVYHNKGEYADIVVASRRWDDAGELMSCVAERHPFLGMTKLNWVYNALRRTIRFIWRIIVISATLAVLVTLYLVWRRT